LPPDALKAGKIHFPSATARQLRRVLRLRPGDVVAVLDGRGLEYRVRLDRVLDGDASGSVESAHRPSAEPRIQISLFQALLPRDRFELVLQKGTEVGISRFVPLQTERSLIRREVFNDDRFDRWRRIIVEATEQSRRTVLPDLTFPMTLREALEEQTVGPRLLAWERESRRPLREALGFFDPPPDRLALLVGPEGGFAPHEIELAIAAGVSTVSLGPRILRAETAGPLFAALCLYELGDLVPR
jgi:16S rRNA (uracil1498-N3)-methyltransferase